MSITLLFESIAAASPHALLATAVLGALVVLVALWHDDLHLSREARAAGAAR